jgi:hypothetical protein
MSRNWRRLSLFIFIMFVLVSQSQAITGSSQTLPRHVPVLQTSKNLAAPNSTSSDFGGELNVPILAQTQGVTQEVEYSFQPETPIVDQGQQQISSDTNAAVSAAASSPIVINIDGDLRASISTRKRDIIWKGKNAGQDDWFAGDPGQSKISLSYNFTDAANPVGDCDILFVNANGTRPFPYMSALNGAFPKFYLEQIKNITVHFDICLQNFTADPDSWLRTSVVVALKSDLTSDRIFFEEDIQDNPKAYAALPLQGGNVAEVIYSNISTNMWVHLDVPFEDFMQTYSLSPFAQSFFSEPKSTFLESVYLVNECYGNATVKYSIANWWITLERVN